MLKGCWKLLPFGTTPPREDWKNNGTKQNTQDTSFVQTISLPSVTLNFDQSVDQLCFIILLIYK